MVNQYKIGKTLGKGAYAKVELGVDVGTGLEYVCSPSRVFKAMKLTGMIRRSRSLVNPDYISVPCRRNRGRIRDRE